MYKAPQSTTNVMTLEQVISKLSTHDCVEGIFTVGSINTKKLVPASDYDLVIVLSAMPVPLHVGFTFINSRMTDLIFTTSVKIEKIIRTGKPFEFNDPLCSIARFLQNGSIVYDPTGNLKKAQKKLKKLMWFKPGANDPDGWCFGVNFNYQHNKRMMESNDPVYQTALNLRFLYNTIYMFWWYFEIRNIPWSGEKEAVRYLQKFDPEYLKLFQKFMAETDRHYKFILYKKIADKTVEPAGGLWAGKPTAFVFDPNNNRHSYNVKKAHAFWQSLFSADAEDD